MNTQLNNDFAAMFKRPDLMAGFPVGTWIMSASPLVAEATAWAGFDWAVVDMEHTPLDMMEVVHILQALSCTSIVPITRIPTNDAIFVKRVMDAGARTLMFPFVENAMQAQQAVAAMKYPPQGIRGMAAMGRASRFGTVQDYFKHANACVSAIVQIETPQAMQNISQIAAVEGVDALFIGPGDLSGAMGHVGDLMHPEVLSLSQKGVEDCHKLGKPIGTVGATPQAVQTYRAMGFDFVGCASDLGTLMRGYAAALSAISQVQLKQQAQGY